jgi:2-amino-4-hydroxy-6-hydroxymethyldihydropteridine diphosphokinase
MARAFIGLGANLGDPRAQLHGAIQALGGFPQTRLVNASSLYRSAPVGYAQQPDFINAVAEVETALSPRDLLDALLRLEAESGRTRSFPNAPRTLDLDLLLYGSEVIVEERLSVPHPRMHERAFVLMPLVEIAPDVDIPGRGAASAWLSRAANQSVEKITSP